MSSNQQQRALIVVDVQRGFDEPGWGPRNNPDCDRNIIALLEAWRAANQPIVLVRHDSVSPGSALAPAQPGNELKPGIDGPHDLFVTKSVNSAFYGTPDLDGWLKSKGIKAVAICGITTNHCCETTARMAGNLGYDTIFVLDATHTFDRRALDGTVIKAEDIWKTTGANLDGEFARVVTTLDAIAELCKNKSF